MDLLANFSSVLDNSVKEINGVLKHLGCSETQTHDKFSAIYHDLKDLLNHHVTQQKTLLSTIQANVDEIGQEALALAASLETEFPEPDENYSLLALDAHLRKHYATLCKRRDQLLDDYKIHKEEEEYLAVLLDEEETTLRHRIPRKQDFDKITARVTALNEIKRQRENTARDLRDRAVAVLENLERQVTDDAEREIVDQSFVSVCLSSKKLSECERRVIALEDQSASNSETANDICDQLLVMWNRLEKPEAERLIRVDAAAGDDISTHLTVAECRVGRPSHLRALRTALELVTAEKRERMYEIVVKVREELHALLSACYASTQHKLSCETLFTSEQYNEEVLSQLEQQLGKWRAYYTRNRHLFDAVSEHQTLWKRYLELEKANSNPGRLNNRGGQLLLEEAERKRIERRLPKLEKDVETKISKYEAETGDVFTVHGASFGDFVRDLRHSHEVSKQSEKEERAAKKAKQLQQESIYGSSTPVRKRLHNNETPHSARKRTCPRLDAVFESTALEAPPCRTPRSNKPTVSNIGYANFSKALQMRKHTNISTAQTAARKIKRRSLLRLSNSESLLRVRAKP